MFSCAVFFLFMGSGSLALLAIKMDNRDKNQLETWEQVRGRKEHIFDFES